ncbi:hypothetical protein COU37_00330 [Candidatus Micrarchaeota archaeon CG10_big_fil_rev_8_21_14_0_10_45_29]|nr:MAG: hypothetical protein COU37_00330 [Candidatus Micrarchaeota archaeon CG10_big_fil_rev_8_21_14_0_10_45_29]
MDNLNGVFKQTCKTIFGKEIGDLKNYESYFKEAVPGMEVKSAFSGETAFAAADDYAKGSKFYNYQKEIDKISTLNKPFNINEIKDIDSLINATRERYVYSSNKILGKFENVSASDVIIDSINIVGSANLSKCKNAAFCFLARESQNVFGCASFGFDTNVIRSCYHKNNARTFECAVEEYLSDSLFCYNVFNSSDCIFCFNLKNKKNMVANIQLTKEQYSSKKADLIEQITSELESKGRLDFSIMGLSGRLHG